MDTGAPLSTRQQTASVAKVGVVVIGRNEGQRLIDCLSSLQSHADSTVYVDSGSTDGSLEAAEKLCAAVLPLDMSIPFTAARARNAGFAAALRRWPDLTFVQFVDGDCEVDGRWIDTASAFLADHPDIAIVFGRRRERFPERTVFNAMCDREWDGAAGEVSECGGDILIRASALKELGGYSDHLIAGEEPELCVRLRERGWKIWRLGAEMTRHDANISHLGQWWRRSVRCGHAYAEVSHLHKASPFRIWEKNVRRAVIWGGIIPLAVAAGGIFHPAMFLLLLVYPLQVLRLSRRKTGSADVRWTSAFFGVLGKFAEMKGIAQFHINRLIGRRQRIIEYK